ncbi:hypothetical protein [Streptomyces olivaceiscleroticus]|uniref:Uncharacterized protein n=1 Tax=Streptomyces olivaceiscleroticus TaxID=68245 RepID=A0ABP3JKY5_9ACTN
MSDQASGSVAPSAPTGYAVVLPPGWARIPLRQGTDEALQEILFTHLERVPEGVPRDKAIHYRLEVRRQVEKAVRSARKNGGLDLYVPVQPRGGILMAASFVIAERHMPLENPLQTAGEVVGQLMAQEWARGEARKVQVGSNPALRWERRVAADPDRNVEVASCRVEYLIPAENDVSRWISIAFSTPGDGNLESEFTAVLVDLFDAVVSTFRWSYE